MENLATT